MEALPVAKRDTHPLDQNSPELSQKDLNIAGASIESSMDSMVKQWGMVKDITTTVSANLEKVTKLLTEQTADLEAIKAPTARPNPIARWAVGASLVATVLSVVSLSLSQTARQEALSKEVTRVQTVPPRPNFGFDTLEKHHSAKRIELVQKAKPPATTPPPAKEVPDLKALAAKAIAPVYGPELHPKPVAKAPVSTARHWTPPVKHAEATKVVHHSTKRPVPLVESGKRARHTAVDSIELAISPRTHGKWHGGRASRASRTNVDRN
jgi:hypothetical protein